MDFIFQLTQKICKDCVDLKRKTSSRDSTKVLVANLKLRYWVLLPHW